MNNYPEIQELLEQRADLYARLKLLAYDGTPEIKENKSGKYLYVRKRVGSRVTSTYVDVYSDTLYQLLLRNNAEAKNLRKQIRKVEKALAEKGFTENELSPDVLLNLDYETLHLRAGCFRGGCNLFPTNRGYTRKRKGQWCNRQRCPKNIKS